MKQLFREPLLHLLLLGSSLFLVYGFLNRDLAGAAPQIIEVDRDKLLSFVQFRTRSFDAARSNELIQSLREEELQRIAEQYVREEALYREAKAMNLDRNDYVARLRLIQQLEFIMRGFADSQIRLTEQEIQRHYEAHISEYWVAPKMTFTHVFINSKKHGSERAAELAHATLSKLKRERVRFDQAPAYGDRFLYRVNYVEGEPDEVASHFGLAMQQALSVLKPDNHNWRGPFESPHGFHLVLLTGNAAGYTPPLEEVRARVEQEASQAALEARFEKSIASVVQTYRVKIKREDFAGLHVDQNIGEKALEEADSGVKFGVNLTRN